MGGMEEANLSFQCTRETCPRLHLCGSMAGHGGGQLMAEAERARREEEERAAWDRYESRWNELLSSEASSEPLTFESIPWPLTSPPRNVEELRPARITVFILSSQHSRGQSMKDRVRHALRRWHPDRFGRILARVREEDRAMVEEGVGIVARCLNGLLERTA